MSHAADDQTKSPAESEPLIAQVLALLGQVTERFDSEEREEWQWFHQNSRDPMIVELMRDSSVIALRVIDAIGRSEPVNGITISTQFRIPKGTVSKVTRRLIAQKLVYTESLPNNRKEVLFRLTPLGAELFQIHRAFDEQMERGFRQFLRRYRADELHLLVRVLQDASEASFLTLGGQPPSEQKPEG